MKRYLSHQRDKRHVQGKPPTSTRQCSHLVETLRNAIHVNKPGDVFVITEVSKKCQFAQRAFRERRLPKYTRHHLYRDGLARNLICS